MVSFFGVTACSSTRAERPAPAPTPTPTTYQILHTWPDLRGVPSLRIANSTLRTQDGYCYCLTPQGGPEHGPSIFDNRGRLVWFHPVGAPDASNLQVVRYNGKNALA